MAILHRATVSPSKAELVETWLDRQPWGGSGAVETFGSYRFDDPEGQVGVEALLVRRGDRLLHVAMTYRGEPLVGREAHLLGTMQHSVLGKRWVHDAAGDPVALGCFSRALTGLQDQAELELWDGDQLVARREPTVELRLEGAGGDHDEVRIVRVIGEPVVGATRLVATWADGEAVVAAR